MTRKELAGIDQVVASPRRRELLVVDTGGEVPGFEKGEFLLLQLDSGAFRNITRHPADDSDPAWSPDGDRITFASDRTGGGDIYVMERDGTDVRQITRGGPFDSHPAWSPDGRSIAFRRRTDASDAEVVGMVNLKRRAVRELATIVPTDDLDASSWRVAWTPDGRWLSTDIGTQITFVNAKTGRTRAQRGLASGLDASPAQPELLTNPQTREQPRCNLCPPYASAGTAILAVPSGRGRRLTKDFAIDSSWSRDGRHIALVLITGETSDDRGLFVIRRDGSGLRRLVPPEHPSHPAKPLAASQSRTVAK